MDTELGFYKQKYTILKKIVDGKDTYTSTKDTLCMCPW